MVTDDAYGTRTLTTGLTIGAAFAAMSFVAPYLVAGEAGNYASVALLAISLVFFLGWFVAWKRGFRIGKPASRAEQRSKEKQKAEREKKMKLMRR